MRQLTIVETLRWQVLMADYAATHDGIIVDLDDIAARITTLERTSRTANKPGLVREDLRAAIDINRRLQSVLSNSSRQP